MTALQRQGRVGLVKTSAIGGGREQIGAQFEYRYDPELERSRAVRRAWRIFGRTHPDENPMCWTLEGRDR